MKSADTIKKSIKQLNITAPPELHERVLGRLLKTMEQSNKKPSAATRPNTWRIIMKSRIPKIAAVAAAITVMVLGLNIIGGPDMASVAWAEILQNVNEIPTVTFSMTTRITFPGDKIFLSKSDIYVAADYGSRSDMFINGELTAINHRMLGEKVAYIIQPKAKTYMRLDLSDDEVGTDRSPDDPRVWLERILSGDYAELDRTNVNGVEVIGIESRDPEVTGSESMTMRVWVDIDTELPVRIEVQGEEEEAGQNRAQEFVMDNFQWNVEIDANVFDPDIPDDYTLVKR